jgi:hypothetical protein
MLVFLAALCRRARRSQRGDVCELGSALKRHLLRGAATDQVPINKSASSEMELVVTGEMKRSADVTISAAEPKNRSSSDRGNDESRISPANLRPLAAAKNFEQANAPHHHERHRSNVRAGTRVVVLAVSLPSSSATIAASITMTPT